MKKSSTRIEFEACIKDLIATESVQSMSKMAQHVDINCLDHSIYVSYISFLICRFFRLNFVAAARGGLLHDLFLYDSRDKSTHQGWHLSSHPKVALKNASSICELTEIESDIIIKHMWPVTMKWPKYKESFIVNSVDKLCALAEALHIYHLMNMGEKLKLAI